MHHHGGSPEARSVGRRRLLRWGVGSALGATAAAAGLVGVGTEEAVAGAPTPRSAMPGSGAGSLGAHVLFRGPADRQAIALTFDDGPSPRWTPRALELLARHEIKATFFVVGSRAAARPGLVRQQVAGGHQVGNHSWDHVDLVRHAPEVVGRQLRSTDTLLRTFTGAPPRVMRPPWGHVDPPGLLAAGVLGYDVVLWSHLIRGSRARSDTDRTLADIGPGAIVLAHDGGPTPSAELYVQLERFVTTMLARGYAFVTVEELVAPGQVVPAQRANP